MFVAFLKPQFETEAEFNFLIAPGQEIDIS